MEQSPGTSRSLSLRAALLALLLGALAYVAVIGFVLAARFGPAASRLQRRSRDVVAEYRASDTRVTALDSAERRIAVMLARPQDSMPTLADLEPLRLSLQAMEENARTLERLGPVSEARDSLSAVLAGGVENEALLRSLLLATVSAVEVGDREAADRLFLAARSMDAPVRAVLSRATGVALSAVNRQEDELASNAMSATRFAALWFLLGALMFPLLVLFLRRRLYLPLAALDRGLARIAAGDLDVELAAPANDELGRVNAHFNRMTEVLRQRATEEEERTSLESAARTRAILEVALDAVVVFDGHGLLREWNPQAERIFGWSRAEVLGHSAAEFIVPAEGRERFAELLRAAQPGAPASVLGKRIETMALRRDGTSIPVELAVTLLDRGGGVEFSAFIRDLTERRRMELELRQSQKMDAVGRLAGGIAHDFNNLLTAIMGSADLVRRDDRATDQIREDAEGIVSTAARGAELARKMLTLARRSHGRLEPVSPDLLVTEVADLVRRTVDRRIEVALDLSVNEPVIRGDGSEIINALLNLALNARDAMPSGGRLEIATRLVDLDESFVTPHSDLAQAGEHVSIVVRDTGTGMTVETRARIFEPFFTTKAPGQGTGLGLAMVYGTIRSHRGIITVDTAPGEGTTFTIFLPVDRTQAPGDAPRQRDIRAGQGRILLVDDEDVVRTVARRMLENLGYEVDTAADGSEAVERVRATPDRWNLILLDGNMPRMTGQDAARVIHDLRPELPLVLCTGFFDGAVEASSGPQLFSRKIAKPYDLATLARALGSLLPPRAE